MKGSETRAGTGTITRNTLSRPRSKYLSRATHPASDLSATPRFYPAVKEIADVFPHSHNEEFRGKDGFIEVTDPIHVHTVEALFFDTLANKGIKRVDDPYGGDVRPPTLASITILIPVTHQITGCCIASASVNPKTWKRSYSANTYLRPFQDRKNFHVSQNLEVSMVVKLKSSTPTGPHECLCFARHLGGRQG